MFLGEQHIGTSTGDFTVTKTFTNALDDCWIDNSMSYFSAKNSDGTWEHRTLNNPTSGTNSKYATESWLVLSSDGKTVFFKSHFGTSRNADKYVYPYIMYYYK